MIATSAIASPLVKGAVQPPPLLERLRKTALDRGTARPTVDQMVGWARAFILFHNKRHPAEMGLAEVGHFLEHVVKTEPDPLPALAQARRALGTLYEDVLGVRLGELAPAAAAARSGPATVGAACPALLAAHRSNASAPPRRMTLSERMRDPAFACDPGGRPVGRDRE